MKRWSNSKFAENERVKKINPEKLQTSPFFRNKVRNIVNKAQRVSEETAMRTREMANEFEKVSEFNVNEYMKSVIVS